MWSPFCYLLSPGYESLRVALGLYPSVKGKTLLCHSHIPDLLLLLLLACTRWCLAVSGNLLPSSCDAGRAGAVASAPSLGDTWPCGQYPGQCLHVPQQEPSLGVIPASHPALLHNHTSSKVSLMLSLGTRWVLAGRFLWEPGAGKTCPPSSVL